METKVAERSNVLTETENKSFIHAVINAVTKGYSDKTVLEDILDLVRRKEVSKGVLVTSPEALRAYSSSLNNSLNFLADEIEGLEVIDEPTVKQRVKNPEPNVVEEEMQKNEEENSKKASLAKFASLQVSEDWDQYVYNPKSNTMTGLLKLCFNQDMSKLDTSGNKLVVTSKEVDDIIFKIGCYFTSEYANIKTSFSKEFLKEPIEFKSLEKGIAEVHYEIKGAF